MRISRARCVRSVSGGDDDRPASCGHAYRIVYTSLMAKIVPVREFRSHLAELLDEVAKRREHVTITRHGRPEAVVIPVDEYDALEETAEILADPETLSAIRDGLDEIRADEVVPLDEVRTDLDRRRSGR
jgi:antitoxin YefM